MAKGIKRKIGVPEDVFNAVRNGMSLFAACRQAGMSTGDFYRAVADDENLQNAYHLALADYADQCTDDIKSIVADLKTGEIDNATAKLLIETEKWLAQKFCPDNVGGRFGVGGLSTNADKADEEENLMQEIVVRFVD